jgi:CubicO group peptidase (beta-lactamase class C family)
VTPAGLPFSIAIVRGATTIYAKNFGLANVDRNVAVDDRTRFAAGSLTKQFTAVAILLLQERKTLRLDDKLVQYMPAFPNASSITLRMLLNHTGLHNYPLLNEHAWPTKGAISNDDIVAILATDQPDFGPGALFSYSNAGYALLADVIRRASGLDEGAFLEQNIFEPLKMTSTGFGYEAQQNRNVATPYGLQSSLPVARELISLDLASGVRKACKRRRDQLRDGLRRFAA